MQKAANKNPDLKQKDANLAGLKDKIDQVRTEIKQLEEVKELDPKQQPQDKIQPKNKDKKHDKKEESLGQK